MLYYFCAVCLVTQLCPTLCDPCTVAHQAPLSMGILQARILEWVPMPYSRGSSQPRDQTHVSHIAGGFFTNIATRKFKNIAVSSLSLLQRILPSRKSSRSLLHCRWILYQLSYQESSYYLCWRTNNRGIKKKKKKHLCLYLLCYLNYVISLLNSQFLFKVGIAMPIHTVAVKSK